jgi:hypothetical protein
VLNAVFESGPAAKVMLARTLLGTFAVATTLLCPISAASSSLSPMPSGLGCKSPQDVLDAFDRSLQLGRLVVFGQKVARHQLVPVRVEFGYELESRVRTITVQSTLLSVITVPENDELVVRDVDVVFDGEGQFMESRAHVYRR